MVKTVRILAILFTLFMSGPSLASPFDAFDRCQDELATGNMIAAKNSALELAQLVPTTKAEYHELGSLCRTC